MRESRLRQLLGLKSVSTCRRSTNEGRPGCSRQVRHPPWPSRTESVSPNTQRLTGIRRMNRSRGESYGVAQEVLSVGAKTFCVCVPFALCVARELTEQEMK